MFRAQQEKEEVETMNELIRLLDRIWNTILMN